MDQPEQQPEDETLRQWKFFQGVDGVPFRTKAGAAPNYKRADSLSKQPKLITDMHVDVFDLSDAERALKMAEVLDLCAKGKGYVSSMDRQYDAKHSNWRVLLIWGQFFLEDPREDQIVGSADNADRQVF